MSDIESSVTKLLIATKQLLECLSQWSRGEASERDVSDIYVNLGNEFNQATASFQSVNIDMRDLENTPNDLRNILERALGEEASITNLDKFLPRIREIIINLLQGLKRKQQVHRVQIGEAAAPQRMRRTESQGTNSSGSRAGDMSKDRSVSPSIRSATAGTAVQSGPKHSILKSSPAKRDLPNLPMYNTSPSQILPPRKAPEPPNVNHEKYVIAPPILTSSDPVSQLSQMTLERRSSKRFSENYLAQLTSSPNGDRAGKLSVDGVRKHLQKSVAIPEAIEDGEDDERERVIEDSADHGHHGAPAHHDVTTNSESTMPINKLIDTPSPSPNNVSSHEEIVADVLVVFVKHAQQTKKLTLEKPLTMLKLKDSIITAYGPISLQQLYIEDRLSKVSYELESITDVEARSVIMTAANQDKIILPETTHAKVEEQDLRSWLDQRLEKLSQDLAQMQSSTNSSSVTPIASHDNPSHPSKSLLPEDSLKDVGVSTAASEQVDPDLLSEHEKVKTKVVELEREAEELRSKIMVLENEASVRNAVQQPTSVVRTANRNHVMSMSAKHEHRGTELTAKLEEAMNTMERIRKDVLQRKVSPRPQQLNELSKVFDEISAESAALNENLELLDAASNKLWEEELTIITTEQDALEYQRAFIDDIRADLEQSLSSLSTIRQVEEQKKFAPMPAVPVLLDTATDPSRAIKFVQADIKSLRVNHEQRAAAIADAEVQRAKEREYLLENEFKNELGSFVESNALKNTGGAAESERIRNEKDDAHRKLLYATTSATPSDQGEVSADTGGTGYGEYNGPPRATPKQIRATSSSASILAKIDASKGMDALERRKSSIMMRQAPSSDSLGTSDRADSIAESVAPSVEYGSVDRIPLLTATDQL